MRKELFKLIVAEFEKLGINPTQWLGTRTNVKRIGKKNLADTPMNEFAIKTEFENRGVERILKLFDEEARYLAQLNDVQGNQLLENLKITNKIVNPAPKKEAGIYHFSKLPGKEITPAEFTGKKAADEAKIQSAQLEAAMETAKVDRDLAKRLNLDMSKASDFDKLQAWKKQHNVPQFDSPEGIASLFKTVDDNPLADLGSQLDNIAKEGKSLADEAQRLTDLAWKMSPEGQAAEEAIRKDILRRGSEGKGFAGGVFGARNDGFFRAIVRPFLLDQHEKGIIKLADNTLESLKNSNDIKSGGGNDFMYADPVRVFRQHYGDNAFDLIPDQEAFGMGPSGYGPGKDRINEVLNKVIGKPIMKVGPDNPGGYLTKGEYQAKLDQQDEILGYINNKEGRFGSMSEKELAEEIADTKRVKDSLMVAFRQDHPTANFQKKDFRTLKEWQDAEVKAQEIEGGAVTKEGFTDPFEIIHGDSKKGKEIAEKLGITAKPGFPVTETGKADLKSVVTKEGFTDPFPGKKSVLPSKEPLNIRLMKNFDQELTDEGLAQEGYNLQEIGVLHRARKRMTTGEELHPNEALLREKEFLADEAGIDVDELTLDIDWGDMTPEPLATGGRVGYRYGEGVQTEKGSIEGQTAGPDWFTIRVDELMAEGMSEEDAANQAYEEGPGGMAQGGGVGSLFRKTDRARYSTGTEIGKEVAKYAGKTIGEIMVILKKNKKIRDLIEKTNKKLHETGIVKMWKEERKLDKDSKIVAEKVLAPFVETVDKMTPWKVSDKSSRNATLAWFREELANPAMRRVYHPEWEKGTTVYRGEKTAKNMEYSRKHESSMFGREGFHPEYKYKPEHVGGFASTSPSQAIKYAVEAEGFPRVTKTHLDPISFQEGAERNVLENPYGITSDVILDAEQKATLKTDLLATGIAAIKKYLSFSKGGLVSRQTLFEDGVRSMFRRV